MRDAGLVISVRSESAASLRPETFPLEQHPNAVDTASGM